MCTDCKEGLNEQNETCATCGGSGILPTEVVHDVVETESVATADSSPSEEVATPGEAASASQPEQD